ncbi:MAG: hypothetical protein JNJ77_20725 [Planctomycetia bacterium]|nr:hypothetical protein [Planctomycetia bacterium]
MKRFMTGLVVCLGLFTMALAAGDIGFIESFALSKDRSQSLKQLIPGTEEYYYYHCLHFLQTEQFQKVREFSKPWVERHGETGRYLDIQTRLALHEYDRQPEATLKYLRDRLGIQFLHEKEVQGAVPNLPTSLDQNLISRERLQQLSLTNWDNLDNYEDNGLEFLAAVNLDWRKRRMLLQRLTRPDITNLVALVAEDLRSQDSGGFGSLNIHRLLTLNRLDELVRVRPELANQQNFVYTRLVRLQPGADEDWKHDPALTNAYFTRLWEYVSKLQPAHNSLKTHVLYHWLVFDRAQGRYDRARFIEYLKLPRFQHYMSKQMLENESLRRFPADLNASLQGVTLLPNVGIDEPLVRSYLKQFLAEAQSPAEFEPYINDVYLKHLFAETKIELGLGDPEQWASQLPPELFKQLKDRVDIDFAHTNLPQYRVDQPVKLELFVKNVPTLLVKVFEINTLSYYQQNQHEVNTDISLDGLVPNEEMTFNFNDSPLRRVSKTFDFPKLNKQGVYIVDFIGGGMSSRALIRKGKLHTLSRKGTAGHVITVLDEKYELVKNAAITLSGQQYNADPDGTILIPYSTQPGNKPIIVSVGDFACIDYLQHDSEAYSMVAGIYVERESLLTQQLAHVIVRPSLLLNGIPQSLKLLENVRLKLISTDQDGIASTTEVPEFKLFEDRESNYEFRVPPRLQSLQVQLSAEVKNLSTSARVNLSAAQSFALNSIELTDKTEDLHLAKFGKNYVIEVLGKTGERKPNRAVQLSLKHREFRQPTGMSLKSDEQGRIMLGELKDISSITATGPESTAHTWQLPLNRFSYRSMMHVKQGDTLSLPYTGTSAEPSRSEMSLFELRSNIFQTDHFSKIQIQDGVIQIAGLTAGDYDLWLKYSNERIRIRVSAGATVAGYITNPVRFTQLPGLEPVSIARTSFDAEGNLLIHLKNWNKLARVHVMATRYLPAFNAYHSLSQVGDAGLSGLVPGRNDAAYITGRDIGDEYRYVLDRKLQKKFPGNMLERPQLLLNPWALRTTETGEQIAGEGGAFGAAPSPKTAALMDAAERAQRKVSQGAEGELTSNLDFLADPAAVILNQMPDQNGVIKLSRKEVGPHAWIHILAVDTVHTSMLSINTDEIAAKFIDLRLRQGLDPKAHYTQQKQITIVQPGQPLTLADINNSRFEMYDQWSKVYGLFRTLTSDAKLTEFAFLLNWPGMKVEEKRTNYSKYACHELNYFLYKKDPEFFKAVVLPYLANKKDKTFMDNWLLGHELAIYLEPWAYGRLNIVERILLAQRIQAEGAIAGRHLNDLYRMLPPDLERMLVLFDTAVKGNEMSAGGVFLGEKAKKPAVELESKFDEQKAAGMFSQGQPPPAAAPGGGRGAGGGMGGLGGGGQDATIRAQPSARSGITINATGKEVLRVAPSKNEDKAGSINVGARVGRDFKDGETREESKKMHHLQWNQKDEGFYYSAEARKRAEYKQLYRKVDPTKEWAENNYYHLPIEQQLAALVNVNRFWLDYVKHPGNGPFFSRYFPFASSNFTEMMFALSVLDVPFTAGKHDMKFEDGKMTLNAASPLIAFHEEVKPAAAAQNKLPILVSQNFYRPSDRYREENGERIDHFITEEFLVHTTYGCQIVVTNPTSSRQKLTVLYQIPVGAMPLAKGQQTKSVLLDLEPYRTQTIDFLFYFPGAGQFAHFPVHIAKNEQYVASGTPFKFNVVEKPTKIDTESWDYVSQEGTGEQVLAHMQRENILKLNLDKIAFRMKDKAFFQAVTKLLRERHVYQATLWSYSVLHNTLPELQEYLRQHDQLIAMCGNAPVQTTPLTINPVDRHAFQHLEYKPLVNARAHSLGKNRQIVNDRLHQQYHHFMTMLSYKKTFDDADRMAITYYLLLQDRYDEAAETFSRIQAGKLTSRMQYDYCAAYLAFLSEEPGKARAIATPYLSHPVDRWRNTFTTVINQLDEMEGKGVKTADADDRAQRQGQLAASEPSFNFTVDNKKINLTWQNLGAVKINYYLMDVELLFSRNPFVQQYGSQFSAIKPNQVQELKLNAAQGKQAFELPADLVNRNVLVEITANGKTSSAPYYANALDVTLQENYGQLKVVNASTSKALPKVYVKVYVRLADGQVKFHKDGYTDYRGKFDYASVSTPEKSPISRFSILVISDELGAMIKECNPPAQ